MNEVLMKMLMQELHASIEDAATQAIENLKSTEITYPPNGELTKAEAKALAALELTGDAKSGLMKLIKDSCSLPLFHLFSLLDGVADPDSDEFEEWYGCTISEKTDDDDEHFEMLHDAFGESYWDYKK